jgi:hypothetical protein
VEEDAPEQDGEELGEGGNREHRVAAGRGGAGRRKMRAGLLGPVVGGVGVGESGRGADVPTKGG